jgi:hypothetical protein
MPKVPRSNPIARTIFLQPVRFSFFLEGTGLAGFGAPQVFFSFFSSDGSGLAASAIIGARG